jgi:hypothetical protein
MGTLLATYTVDGARHRIELVRVGAGALLLDRCAKAQPRVVAEFEPREDATNWADCLLHGDGAYLARARTGERLCRPLRHEDLRPGERQLARAA